MSVLLHLPRIHFGFGSAGALSAELDALGVRRPLIVSDAGVRASGGLDLVLAALGQADVAVFDGITEPPTLAGADAAAAAYRSSGCDGIVAIGGGSVIDTAKMACVLATHPGVAADYAGHSERLVKAVAPLVVLPTTAGSGSEVSPSTGIHPAPGQAALRTRASALVPRVTLCDPQLTLSMPPRLTACSGLDALTHCIEGYLSPVANPVIDAIALAGVSRIAAHLERAVADGSDREARAAMMMGALEGGISIGKGLGPAHAMATAFSHWPVPHGLLAALSLPPSLELLAQHAPERTARLAQVMGLPPGSSAAAGFRTLLRAVQRRVDLPLTLRQAGSRDADPEQLARSSAASPVNLTSPHAPTIAEYRRMVGEVLG